MTSKPNLIIESTPSNLKFEKIDSLDFETTITITNHTIPKIL